MARKISIIVLSVLIAVVAAVALTFGLISMKKKDNSAEQNSSNSSTSGSGNTSGGTDTDGDSDGDDGGNNGGNGDPSVGPHICSYEFIETIPNDCGHDGYDLYKCSICGKQTKSNLKLATGDHKYELITHLQTCTSDWYQAEECTVCGDVIKDTVNTVPDTKIPHNYNWMETKEPTCTEKGLDTGVCSMCGDTVTETVDALGHSYGGFVYNKDATCIKDGTETRECSTCGNKDTKTKAGSALGHAYGDYVSNNDRTCTQSGTLTAVCGKCGGKDTIVDSNNLAGHKYGEWYDIQGKCGQEGTRKHKCKDCDFVETEKIVIKHEFEHGQCKLCKKYVNPTDSLYPMGKLTFSDIVNNGNHSDEVFSYFANVKIAIESMSSGKPVFMLAITQDAVGGYLPESTGYHFDNLAPNTLGAFEVTLWNFDEKKKVTFSCNIDYTFPEGEDCVRFFIAGVAKYVDDKGNEHVTRIVSDQIDILLETV